MNAQPANEEDIVAFFRALSKEARLEYSALAERDRKFGEDVEAEERERESS